MAFGIEKKDWNKIINYARARHAETNDEIGGMALIKPVPNTDDYRISHPTILKQETSGGNCILDKEALANYYVDMAMKHGKDVQFLWWHSHASMAAFWSTTDTNTMKEYASGDWSAFLVVNIREEHEFRITCWKPQEMYIDTDLEIIGVSQKKIPTNIVDEVAEKCSVIIPKYKAPVVKRVNTKPIDYTDQYTQQSLLEDEASYYGSADQLGGYYGGYGTYQPHHIIALSRHNARSWACSAIDELNNDYMDGTVQYVDYVASIADLNKELTKVGSELRVACIGEGTLFNDCQQKYPFQFLENDIDQQMLTSTKENGCQTI